MSTEQSYAEVLRQAIVTQIKPDSAGASTKQVSDSPGARLLSVQKFAAQLAKK